MAVCMVLRAWVGPLLMEAVALKLVPVGCWGVQEPIRVYRLYISQSGYSIDACMVLLARVEPLLMEGVALGWMLRGWCGTGLVEGRRRRCL